jgi:hypothetical protein
MENHKTVIDPEEDEVLDQRMDALLHKHQNQKNVTTGLNVAASSQSESVQTPEGAAQLTELSSNDKIPTLTEVVFLPSAAKKIQSRRSLSLRQILDVALEDVEIDMNTSDRIALIHALEKYLIRKPD